MPSRRDEMWEIKRQRFFANRDANGCGSGGQGAPGRGPGAGGRRGAPSQINTGAPFTQEQPEPNSPLSRLVQGGYPTPTGARTPSPHGPGPGACGGGGGNNLGNYSSALPPRAPGMNRSGSSNQNGFDANVAQQWSGNIQQTAAMHQQIQTQQSDPNFTGKYTRPSGYRVSQQPGGGSSISLSWGGGSDGDTSVAGGSAASRYRSPGTGAGAASSSPRSSVGRSAGGGGGGSMASCLGGGDAFQQQGRGRARAPSPGMPPYANGAGGNRAPSPGMAAYAAAGVRAPSPGSRCGGGGARAPSPGGGLPSYPGGPASQQSYGSSARAPSPYSSAGGRHGGPGGGLPNGGGFGAPPAYGGARQSEGMGLAFGGMSQNGSSNSYACGANQNCGNMISDRRMTRVAKPPGGGSSVCFG